MDFWVLWIIAGLVLVIAELVTGTFYLLVLGVGGFAAALVAWAGGNALLQVGAFGVLAIGGVMLVHHWHESHRNADERSNFLDLGQPVVLEGWANEAAGLARVKYRGTSWDARLSSAAARPTPGSTLYIQGQEGHTLVVVDSPP